jgi:hypothetical protein
MPRHLTKTSFVAGCQCHDLLWWTVLEPDAPELEESISLEHRFEQGRQVAELARSYVPGGALIDVTHDRVDARIQATRDAIDARVPVIYEAAFFQDNVFVAVDILERLDRGFNLIEVKSTTGVKQEHIPDVAIQTHVLRAEGLDVRSTELMHLNRECCYPDLSNLFIRENVTRSVDEMLPLVPAEISAQLQVLDGEHPAVGFGEHCLTGRECPFRDRCWPNLNQEHVLTLYQLKPSEKWDLMQRGIESILDLPSDFCLNRRAERQVRAVRRNAMVLGPGMRAALEPFVGQLAHLDFETVSLAVPVWEGFRPWQQMPVQFSCHVETVPGRFEHHEFLADTGSDCRPAMARALVDACEGVDGVVAYNAGFERQCIGTLQTAAPALADQLDEIAAKLLDPLQLVRDYVYHPGFMGRFGLKYVLPVLVPELGYDDLHISQGEIASLNLAKLLFRPEAVPEEERPQLRNDLLEYCKRDTMATVVLVRRLKELAERTAEQ